MQSAKAWGEKTYEEKIQSIFSEIDPERERISNGMVYCRKCYQPKMFVYKEKNIVSKCSCRCEELAWERERTGHSPVRRARVSEIRSGDWNPFDGRRR